MNRRPAALAIWLAAAFVVAASLDAPAFSPAERTCRDTIAKEGVKLAKLEAKLMLSCHKRRDRERLDPGIACNDIAQADTRGRVAGSVARLSTVISAACSGLNPSDLGYSACPAPCDAAVPAIGDFTDVAACVACLVENTSESLAANALGSPSVPLGKDVRRCRTTIGSNWRKFYQVILKERRLCQRQAEAEGATDTASCRFADPRSKIQRRRANGETAIDNRCSGVNLIEVDSCSTVNLFFLKGCLFVQTDNWAETLFERFYELSAAPTTTTTVPVTTTVSHTTTTVSATTTTVPATTTTTLPGGQDPQCPNRSVLRVLAGVGATCATNADCLAGTCDPDLGRCRTVTDLDTGFTGISHDADVNDAVATAAFLLCPGQPSPVPGQPCGQCEVLGLDPSTGDCRCAGGQDCTTNADCPVGWCDTSLFRPICKGANRVICNEPFQPDADDCGGAMCNCYFGPPLPLSAGNTPACVVNRFAQDITGTVNVDTGEGTLETHLRSLVFLGRTLVEPCPYCAGDTVPNDGVRDGVCVFGDDDGQPCDAQAINTTFPAPGGGAHSLDCFPSSGKNVSGAGLVIDITQTTGTVSLPAAIPCGTGELCPCATCVPDRTRPCTSNADCAGLSRCPIGSCDLVPSRSCSSNADCQNLGPCKRKKCKQDQSISCTSDADCLDVGPCNRHCTGDVSIACGSNADCVAADRCEKVSAQVPVPDQCTGACVPDVDGQGVCDPPMLEQSCDGIVRADGRGFISCFSNADCTPQAIGVDAGACTLVSPRRCFLDPIVAQGVADPVRPVGAGVFCIPPTSSPGINNVAGLPGPGRVINQGYSKLYCASDPNVEYTPGVGGCP